MSPARLERLAEVARLARGAGWGERRAIYRAACTDLGLSLATLHRKLKKITVKPSRSQRADAGQTALPFEEAELISSYLLEHVRKNDKRIKTLKYALRELRANGAIVAGRVAPTTGAVAYLCESTVSQALRLYRLHPDQVLQPDPVTPLKSNHPNHVWQIDASLCVLYKLPTEDAPRLDVLGSQEKYKNKLSNWAKIEHRLVQRYAVTDHASGAIFIWFALGGESAASLCRLLAEAVVEKHGFPFHGAPLILMLDQASANKSALFRNLARALSIRLHYTRPGNPRSKGQVEQAHNLIECNLESGLKLADSITDVVNLNRIGQRWVAWFNGTEKHTRHGKTRFGAWQQIQADQLRRVALTVDQLMGLSRENPIERPVTPLLTVRYKAREYDVSRVAGVIVGEKLLVCRSAWTREAAQVVLPDDQGRESFFEIPEKRREGPFNFYADAAEIGAVYKRHDDTPAQTAKKALNRLAMDAETDAEAEALRKARTRPFGGRINPYKEMEEYQAPKWLPKRGTLLDLNAPRLEQAPVSVEASAKRLRDRYPDLWSPAHYAWLARCFPHGVPSEQLDGLIDDGEAFRSATSELNRRIA